MSFQTKTQPSAGFSLFETLIVTTLLVTLFSITTLSFYSILKRDEMAAAVQELTSTIKEAQIKTLSGTTFDNQNPTNFGVYFEEQKYFLFEGTSFSPDNPNNQPPINLPSAIILSQINLPNHQVAFAKVTGEIIDYDEDQNSLTITNTANNQIKTITVNKLGVIDVQ